MGRLAGGTPGPRRAGPPPGAYEEPQYKALARHQGLRKHESSLLTQVRTGKVGLRAFLFERKVPSIATPLCRYGEAQETAVHLVLDCSELEHYREALRQQQFPRALYTLRDFVVLTANPRRAASVIRWLLSTGRFPEFRFAEQMRDEEEDPGGQ